jgi:hypothetical protein
MKPLNRPMFRYGGPIKEGVMSGIREPKKNGGSMMANDEGPRRAALVGNPIYPKGPDGRTNHVLPFVIGQGLRMAARPFGKFVMRQMAGPVKKNLPIKNLNLNLKGTPIKGGLQAERFSPNPIGNYFLKSPEAGLVSAIAKGTGKIAGPVKRVATAGVKSPLTVGGGLLYIGGKFFNKDGTPASADAIAKSKASDGGPPGGGDPSMFATPKETSIPQLSAEERRAKNVERYRDIMDIKGMNKDAAYNSLIAASQAINESGDFKGDIKSGKLINQIIQATSKQFDKPKATKDAIDTLILKGEIEKDLNKEKNALENKKTNLQIKAAEKALAGDSFDEAILKKITSTSGKMPTGSDLAGILKATRGIDSVVLDGSQVTPGGEVKFLQESVNEKIKEGTSVNPGAYVLNSKILIVDEQGNVSQYY